MMATIVSETRPRIAASIKLIIAMWQLQAAIEDQFGRAVIDILKAQFPGQDIDISPAALGRKMLLIAKKEVQGNIDNAMDVVQDFLTYITTGSREVRDPETGELVERTVGSPWDFTKADKTWRGALDKILRNIKTTGISRSQQTTGIRDSDRHEYGIIKWKEEHDEPLSAEEAQNKKRLERTFRLKNVDLETVPAWDPDKPWGSKEKGIEEAFGQRGEEGGEKSGGEGRIPTTDETALGKSLDDKAAIREFIGLIDEHIPDLRTSLSPDCLKLFDLIFTDEIGSFGSNIKENMGQASALKAKHPDLYQKNSTRWSGFVNGLRKQLLSEIWKYIETEMSKRDFERLYEEFFSDTTPREVEKVEQKKIKDKELYQQGIDERKLGRLLWKQQNSTLSSKDQKDFDRLKKKLESQGVDTSKIEPLQPKKGDEDELMEVASVSPLARRVAACWLIEHGW